MTALVCYASDNMTISQENLVVSSLRNGVEKVFNYSQKDIDPFFYGVNKDVLSKERGAGYWLWKPYVINKALLELNDGDILIYSDAGVKIVNLVSCLTDRMDEDILFFTNGFKHVEWCKADPMKAINFRVRYDDFDEKQVQASVIVMKVTDKVRGFMREWLAWCQVPGLIDDSPSKETNFKTFAEHRHDQAILTCLQIKYGYKLHWWPTIYSDHLPRTDSYPVMFDHHRKRNNEW